ncbi:hypothetical protein RUND412_010790 [Rhizina undulata]
MSTQPEGQPSEPMRPPFNAPAIPKYCGGITRQRVRRIRFLPHRQPPGYQERPRRSIEEEGKYTMVLFPHQEVGTLSYSLRELDSDGQPIMDLPRRLCYHDFSCTCASKQAPKPEVECDGGDSDDDWDDIDDSLEENASKHALHGGNQTDIMQAFTGETHGLNVTSSATNYAPASMDESHLSSSQALEASNLRGVTMAYRPRIYSPQKNIHGKRDFEEDSESHGETDVIQTSTDKIHGLNVTHSVTNNAPTSISSPALEAPNPRRVIMAYRPRIYGPQNKIPDKKGLDNDSEGNGQTDIMQISTDQTHRLNVTHSTTNNGTTSMDFRSSQALESPDPRRVTMVYRPRVYGPQNNISNKKDLDDDSEKFDSIY